MSGNIPDCSCEPMPFYGVQFSKGVKASENIDSLSKEGFENCLVSNCHENFQLKKTENIKSTGKLQYTMEDIMRISKEYSNINCFFEINKRIKEIIERPVYVIKRKSKTNKNRRVAPPQNNSEQIIKVYYKKPMTDDEKEKFHQRTIVASRKFSKEIDTRKIYNKKIKIMLNKICPSNIETLKPQFLAFGKQSLEALHLLVKGIYTKSLTETMYTQLYALLCEYLNNNFNFYLFEEKYPTTINNWFRFMLLDYLQTTFESVITINQNSYETKIYLPDDIKKAHGCISFTGALFKYKIISPNIIQYIVDKLLNFGVKKNNGIDEENIKLVCILMLNAGNAFKINCLKFLTQDILSFLNELLEENISLNLRPTILVNYI